MSKGIYPRFMDYVESKDVDSCWEWKGYKSKGYGRIKIFGKFHQAHRISYELFTGPIPDHMMVCHRCDNPSCVNPGHLFIGSAKDNMQDKISKGRHRGAAKGERHHFSSLTEHQVIEIRKMLSSGGMSQIEIARIFGVSQSQISNIKTCKRW